MTVGLERTNDSQGDSISEIIGLLNVFDCFDMLGFIEFDIADIDIENKIAFNHIAIDLHIGQIHRH